MTPHATGGGNDASELAGRYFDEYEAEGLRRSGMPEDGVAHLREYYIAGVLDSPVAQQTLRRRMGQTPQRPTGTGGRCPRCGAAGVEYVDLVSAGSGMVARTPVGCREPDPDPARLRRQAEDEWLAAHRQLAGLDDGPTAPTSTERARSGPPWPFIGLWLACFLIGLVWGYTL